MKIIKRILLFKIIVIHLFLAILITADLLFSSPV